MEDIQVILVMAWDMGVILTIIMGMAILSTIIIMDSIMDFIRCTTTGSVANLKMYLTLERDVSRVLNCRKRNQLDTIVRVLRLLRRAQEQ